jgi:blocked-early-in-transport protein 1
MANNPMYQRRNKGASSKDDIMYSKNNGSYDIEGGRRRAGNDTNANILESQNNERIDLLSEQVSRLKGLTIDIGNEVREQNSLLDTMGDGFSNTRDMLQNSLVRIGTMLESGGAKHMCYMVAFCVFVLLFLWWLMGHKDTRGG